MSLRYSSVIYAVLICLAAISHAGGLLLAANHSAQMPIVISATASKQTREIAELLSQYLGKISGATFPVKTGNGNSGIVLGTLAEFAIPGLGKPLEVRNGYDGSEAYAIRTEEKRLLLIAATEKGVSHAAFRLLEELGYRRFFPAPEWEVIPSLPMLKINLSINDRPVILARRIWAGMGSYTGKADTDFRIWRLANRMDSSFSIYCGHAWPSIYLANKAEFEQHPEYLSLVNGKRTAFADMQLCVTNPDVQKLGIKFALDFLKNNSDQDMVSVEPNDGGNYCECENCRKLGSKSNYVFYYANIVARAVKEQYPGKMVGLYAYAEHSDPPDFALEPNIYVQMTNGYNWGKYSFDDLLKLWPKKVKNFGVYEYYNIWISDMEKPPLSIGANVSYLRSDIQRLANAGATSIDAECSTDWGPYGRGYYVANRLMWNPAIDTDAVLNDFYAKAFGPAALPMKHYYERFDPGNKVPISEDTWARAFNDLKTAGDLARERQDVQARLDDLKLYMHYVRLYWQYEHETDKARKKSLAFELLRHIYRMKDKNLLYNFALLGGWTTSLAPEFDEPVWNAYEATQPKPYAKDPPYTKIDIARLFQEDLKVFHTVDLVPLKTFSKDLLPVAFPNNIPATINHLTQFGVKYVFYVIKDEPLIVDVTAGLCYQNKPPVNWQVLNANEKVVNTGTIPLDKSPHRIEVTGLAPGMYYFTTDSATGLNIKVPVERPFSVVLDNIDFAYCGTMAPVFFYVPKGTGKFQYYAYCGAHEVLTPDETIAKKVTEGYSTYVTVEVPTGMDGKPWCLRGICIGKLIFRNVPNYFANSPNGLLVPRELVLSDKLRSLAVRVK